MMVRISLRIVWKLFADSWLETNKCMLGLQRIIRGPAPELFHCFAGYPCAEALALHWIPEDEEPNATDAAIRIRSVLPPAE